MCCGAPFRLCCMFKKFFGSENFLDTPFQNSGRQVRKEKFFSLFGLFLVVQKLKTLKLFDTEKNFGLKIMILHMVFSVRIGKFSNIKGSRGTDILIHPGDADWGRLRLVEPWNNMNDKQTNIDVTVWPVSG